MTGKEMRTWRRRKGGREGGRGRKRDAWIMKDV